MEKKIFNLNIVSEEILLTPRKIKASLPLDSTEQNFVAQSRSTLEAIFDRRDPRLCMVVGPCSVHDMQAAREYAAQLKTLAEEVQSTMFLVMRLYFEKPRTTIGWKGFINDPRLDDSFRIDEGLFKARELLIDLARLGLPAGTEALDPITPQYFDDLITWTAIGARTTESQKHREMSSGLSTPVGFKNGTDGNIEVAVNAMQSCMHPHHFLGMNQDGQVAVMHTRGNKYGHIILRGGKRPNYDSVNIALCEKHLAAAGLSKSIMIDCSHGNSLKDPALQPLVLKDCISQICDGNQSIVGTMIESNLEWGRQDIPSDLSQLRPGVSVTDACIDWKTTETVLKEVHESLKPVLEQRLNRKES